MPRALLILLCCCSWHRLASALERHDFSAALMGTTFRIALHAESQSAAEQAADGAFQHIAALNAIFSDYEPHSELMRLCQAPPHQPFTASPTLFDLITRSLSLSQLTDGAFDITCGNLTQLWRRTRRLGKLPPKDRLATALLATDWKAVVLDPAARTITLTRAGMLLDLGGIAKGYAADAALRLLRDRGITRALVMAGGDVAIGDPPPDYEAWEIKLRTAAMPADVDSQTLPVTRLKNCGVSTSGDLYQFIEIDGVRYSHIVSPRTGLGLTDRIACTVIAKDCTTSDALATAMCVLGKDRGMQLARKLDITARFAP